MNINLVKKLVFKKYVVGINHYSYKMKSVLFVFALFIASFGCIAQPNGGFENWAMEFNYESPVGWQTLNFLNVLSSSNSLSAFKVSGIDKHSGNYALKLKTVKVNANPVPNLIDDTVGVVFTGTVNISPPSLKYGFTYDHVPEKLNFWYKYIPVGDDEALVGVLATRWNGIKRDTISLSEVKLDTIQANYAPKTLNLTASSSMAPDSITVYAGSSRKLELARVGSTLYLDDLSFSGWLGVSEYSKKQSPVLGVFPNPAKENIVFNTDPINVDRIDIHDIYGRIIESFPVKNAYSNFSCEFIKAGTYFYTAYKNNNPVDKGKFNVLK